MKIYRVITWRPSDFPWRASVRRDFDRRAFVRTSYTTLTVTYNSRPACRSGLVVGQVLLIRSAVRF